MTKKQTEEKTEVVNIIEDDDYEEHLKELKKSKEIGKQRKKVEETEKK